MQHNFVNVTTQDTASLDPSDRNHEHAVTTLRKFIDIEMLSVVNDHGGLLVHSRFRQELARLPGFRHRAAIFGIESDMWPHQRVA